MAEIEIPQPQESQKETSLVRTIDSTKNKKQTYIKKTDKPESSGKTIKGKATKKELSFGEKLKRSFVKEDMKEVRDYIIFDVLIPSAKQSLLDMIIGAVSQTLGIPTSRSRRSNGYSGTSIADTGERPFRNYASSRQTSGRSRDRIRYDRFRVTDIVFEYKEDAMSLLEQMMDICDQYGWFSVFDFYDKAGITEGNDYTNRNYGWTNVDGADIVFEGSGYVINLPRARMR